MKLILVFQVFPSIESIQGNLVKFENGMVNQFDAIIFATGYKSTVNYWLKVTNYKVIILF